MNLAERFEEKTGQKVETDFFGTVIFTAEYVEWLEVLVEELEMAFDDCCIRKASAEQQAERLLKKLREKGR